MLIGHSRQPPTLSIAGTGATIVAGADQVADGRPDTLTAFTFNTGVQNTGIHMDIQLDWTTAIVPRAVGLSNISLPVGTKIDVLFKRATDGSTYPYAPTMYASTQRVVAGPRGERTAWLLPQPGATAVIGAAIRVWNDVNGSASLAAGAAFTVGEAWVSDGTDYDIDTDWTDVATDPTVTNASGSSQLFGVIGVPYRELTFSLLADGETVVYGGANDPDVLAARIDRGQTCLFVPRYTDANYAFSADMLHRSARLARATSLPGRTHISGPVFGSNKFTVREVPVPA